MGTGGLMRWKMADKRKTHVTFPNSPVSLQLHEFFYVTCGETLAQYWLEIKISVNTALFLAIYSAMSEEPFDK